MEIADSILKWKEKNYYVGLFLSKESDPKTRIKSLDQLHKVGVLASVLMGTISQQLNGSV